MTYRRDLQSRVSEGQDIIDTRDIVERIKELEDERAPLAERADETTDNAQEDQAARATLAEWDGSEEGGELLALRQVRDDYCGGEDFAFGETLIADHYFETYAEELADDIGAIDKKQTWPNNCIDWKEAARQLQQDYSSLEYGSTTYWFRS